MFAALRQRLHFQYQNAHRINSWLLTHNSFFERKLILSAITTKNFCNGQTIRDRIMLREFKTESELREVRGLIDSQPSLFTLRAALYGTFPESPVEVYGYPWPFVKCWLLIIRNRFTEPYVGLYLVNGGTVDDAEKCMESANDVLDQFNEIYLFNIEETVCTHLCNVLSKKYEIGESDICITYYMPPDVQAEVAKRVIELPAGYRFCDLDPEIDGPLVSRTWKYAKSDDINFTRSKLTRRPSVGVKYGDQLVSFEMVCPSGAINHLYTLPEFRGNGLGTAVELKLCQKLIAIGIWPFKFVEIVNPKVIEMSKKSGFWHQVTEPITDEAMMADFRILKKRR